MNPGFVADASVAAAWVVKSQSTDATDSLFVEVDAGAPVHVPVLWMFEVANALRTLRRRRRIDQQGYAVARAGLGRLRPFIDTEGPQLALRKTVPLATRDSALNKAARRAGVRTLL